MKKTKQITADEWIDSTFTTLLSKPENSFTVEDVMRKTGMSRSHTINRLNDMVARGKLKSGKCKINKTLFNYYIPITT
jgi:hypothetical protein